MLETTTMKLVSPTGNESASCHSLPVLPNELIMNILLRVPVRSLLRFKCVCKSWNSLISDPQFAKDHFRTSTANPNVTHQRLVSSISGPKILSLSLESLRNPLTPAKSGSFTMRGLFRILGSCNGLLCLYAIHQQYVTLWNPSIGFTSKRFPTDDGVSTFHGFGYDAVSDKYKLLLTMRLLGGTVTKIYTFGGANFCSRVIQNLPSNPHPTEWPGKFVSGTINWVATKSFKQWMILSFDFGTETYGEVLLPKDSDNVCKPVIDVMRNCLCICFYDSKKAHWVVWLMKEYGVQDSWTKLMIIPRFVEEDDWPSETIMSRHDELDLCFFCPSLRPLCISEDGVCLFKTSSSKLVLYNSNDGRLDYLSIRGNFQTHHESLVYHESLVSP